jgi:hypothetical protein
MKLTGLTSRLPARHGAVGIAQNRFGSQGAGMQSTQKEPVDSGCPLNSSGLSRRIAAMLLPEINSALKSAGFDLRRIKVNIQPPLIDSKPRVIFTTGNAKDFPRLAETISSLTKDSPREIGLPVYKDFAIKANYDPLQADPKARRLVKRALKVLRNAGFRQVSVFYRPENQATNRPAALDFQTPLKEDVAKMEQVLQAKIVRKPKAVFDGHYREFVLRPVFKPQEQDAMRRVQLEMLLPASIV